MDNVLIGARGNYFAELNIFLALISFSASVLIVSAVVWKLTAIDLLCDLNSSKSIINQMQTRREQPLLSFVYVTILNMHLNLLQLDERKLYKSLDRYYCS